MKKTLSIALILILAMSVPTFAKGVQRVEISPSGLVNLGSGHSGAFMGGALTGDIYFSRTVALRTTIGFTKDRLYPSELSYSDADYSFWLSMAPYVELQVGNTWKPYVAFIGNFGAASGSQAAAPISGFVLDRSPVSRIQPASSHNSFYSLGGTIGSKFHIAGPISVFADVSHFFYTHVSDDATFYNSGIPFLDQVYSFEDNPTYLSFGLTYTMKFGDK